MNCYNGQEYLEEAIDSIYAQSYKNWEIIFWDNGSTDDSEIIAKNYDERLKYFFREETQPLGVARNLALKEASGDYVAFLDCDDIFLPDKIRTQLMEMQAKDAVLSYGSWIKIDENGCELKKIIVKKNYYDRFESLYVNYHVNFQTLMIQNNFLKENMINFDENLKFSADHNLVLRIAYLSPLLSIDKVLAKYRVHNKSLSSNRKKDKYHDVDYTRNFFIEMGANEKYKNFNFFSRKAIIFMHIRDSYYDKNFKNFLKFTIQYLMLITRVFLNKSNTSSYF
jgi:glycosyltransferase involved in cell wall biosynthesis